MFDQYQIAEKIAEELFPVALSDKAVEMAKSALKHLDESEGDTLRISVEGGGCAGLRYALNFVNDTSCFDLTAEKQGLPMVIDIFSANHLANATVDYVESIDGAGFKFDNPSAQKTCGCGSSFG